MFAPGVASMVAWLTKYVHRDRLCWCIFSARLLNGVIIWLFAIITMNTLSVPWILPTSAWPVSAGPDFAGVIMRSRRKEELGSLTQIQEWDLGVQIRKKNLCTFVVATAPVLWLLSHGVGLLAGFVTMWFMLSLSATPYTSTPTTQANDYQEPTGTARMFY